MTTKNSALAAVTRQGAEKQPPQNGLSIAKLPADTDDIAARLRRRREPDGLDQAIANSASDWWAQGALLAIKQLSITGRGFTVDHLLDMVGAPSDSHYVGAVFAAAQRLRIIEPVGARVGGDGRLVRVWWSAS